MNTDQLLSHVRSALKVLGTLLAAHGMAKVGALFNAEDTAGVITVVVGFLWSHATHADDGTPKQPFRNSVVLLALIPFLALSNGCASRLASGGAYAPQQPTLITNVVNIVVTNQVAGLPKVETVPVSTVKTNWQLAADMPLYIADLAYKTAYDTVDGLFRFEYENRAQLQQIAPQIKTELDKLRPIIWDIDQRWAKSRWQYKSNPLPENLQPMQAVLFDLQKMIPIVQQAVSSTNK